MLDWKTFKAYTFKEIPHTNANDGKTLISYRYEDFEDVESVIDMTKIENDLIVDDEMSKVKVKSIEDLIFGSSHACETHALLDAQNRRSQSPSNREFPHQKRLQHIPTRMLVPTQRG